MIASAALVCRQRKGTEVEISDIKRVYEVGTTLPMLRVAPFATLPPFLIVDALRKHVSSETQAQAQKGLP